MRTAFVTGAEGFIGAHLVKFLQRNGWNVVGGYRAATEQLSSLPNVSYVEWDLTVRSRSKELLEEYRPTTVFHLAAQSLPTLSWADPISTFECNLMGSLYLFEAVRSMASPALIVSACSSAEYGFVKPSAVPVTENHPLQPLHPYGISKLCLDLLARQYFLNYRVPTVNVRLFNTTGPGKLNDAPSDFIRQVVRIKRGLQEPTIKVGNLAPRRAFLDVEDAVRGFYLAARKGRHGEVYNLCARTTHSMSELLRKAIRIAGIKADIVTCPELMRPSDEKIIFGSTRKIKSHTGWKQAIPLEQTLHSMLKYWNSCKGGAN
jgi:GDP-4-dehydro-6-deoxy-D-mannose reductase